MSGPTIRDATTADLPAILAIFNHYIEHTTASFRTVPETEPSWRVWFDQHGERHPVLVAVDGDEVIGWAALNPHKPPGGYRHTAEFSIYLREGVTRRGLGRRLLTLLLERARTAGHHVVIGGACTESTASMKLMEAMGFEKAAHFREVGFKFGRWLDVAYYQIRL